MSCSENLGFVWIYVILWTYLIHWTDWRASQLAFITCRINLYIAKMLNFPLKIGSIGSFTCWAWTHFISCIWLCTLIVKYISYFSLKWNDKHNSMMDRIMKLISTECFCYYFIDQTLYDTMLSLRPIRRWLNLWLGIRRKFW